MRRKRVRTSKAIALRAGSITGVQWLHNAVAASGRGHKLLGHFIGEYGDPAQVYPGSAPHPLS